ncbi:MAG: AmmeMemoRadiSam system protein A [Gammaproteobacteria bacterium]|nr:AmmeMemoRadiSam system protein A [Gammaproteobacteria bacterium]
MVHSSCIELDNDAKRLLLDIARRSIESGVNGGFALKIDKNQIDKKLTVESASFVTLTQNDQLRGCMGNLQASEALAQSVANTAYNAAFRDPRFPSLTANGLDQTVIEISILSPMEPMSVASRADLLIQLQPGNDGLMIEDGRHRSTFLPKVWESLKYPENFISHLMIKAGLPADHWSDTMQVHRYHTLSFHE